MELKGSCASLGIDPKRCIALDRPDIQDNPKVWWDKKVIEGIVKEYVGKWQADAVSFPIASLTCPFNICRFQILTFDSGGVSGHINHRAVSSAIR